jgi:hypothetical protein
MVHLDTILEGLGTACNNATLLSDQITYATIVLDREGDHSDVTPPVVEFSVEEIQRDTSRNTEKNGPVVDDSGKQIDGLYSRWWNATIAVEVLSVAGTGFTHRGIEQDLRQVLYQFDNHGPNKQIPNPCFGNSGEDGCPENPDEHLENVTELKLQSIEPQMDFNTSPSIRTRRLRIDTKFVHDLRATDLGEEFDDAGENPLRVALTA